MKRILPALIAFAAGTQAEDSSWVSLFNGKDLADWDIKFTKHPLNANLNNTVKVTDGLLSIDYGEWSRWGGEFGHIGYKVRPFSRTSHCFRPPPMPAPGRIPGPGRQSR